MDKRAVLYICVFGFILRAINILFFNREIIFEDEERFWTEALSVANDSRLYASGKFAHDMPMTGLLLGIIAIFSGESIIAAKLIIAILSSVTIYFIASLSHNIYPSRYSSLLAAGISSCYPFFIYYSSLLFSETIFMVFLTLFFVQLIDSKRKIGWQGGLTAGLTHLTRPTLLYFLPIVLIWQYFINKCCTKNIVFAVLIFTVLITPWGIRNYVALGHFHLTTSGSGQALLEGNNPWNKTGGVSGQFTDSKAYLADLPKALDEIEQDEWKQKKAIQYIKDNPYKFYELSVKKFIRFWNIWPNSPDFESSKYKLISLLSFGPVLILSIISIFVFRQHFKRLMILYLFIGYYTCIHMVTIGSIRYRLPLEPILIALASAVISKILVHYKSPV